MMRRGFTIVELAITITIMGILLTLAVVNLNGTQANARDAERKGDVEAIALNLENFYVNLNPDIPMSGGSYLGLDFMTDSDITTYLPDIDPKSIHAPDISLGDPMSIVVATNANTTTTGVTPQPSSTNDVYVYQPLTGTGTLCASRITNGDCRRFNIYYFQETDNQVHKLTSKRQ